MNIGFDIDDVLHEFVGNLIPHLNKHTGKEITIEAVNNWQMANLWNIEFCEMAKVIKDSGIYIDNSFYENISIMFEKLKTDGHEIHLITSRILYDDFDTERHTKEWLRKYDVKYDSLTITSEKGVICKELCIDYFIDDSLENIYKIYRDSPQTIPVIMKQNWNGTFEYERLKSDRSFDINILNSILSNVSIVNNVDQYIDLINKRHNI